MAASIAENLELVRHRIAAAAARAGRRADEVELVAVSKTFPAEAVREAAGCGQAIFGESRVQEAAAKIPELPGRLAWHFIGHLQKNKIRKILPLCSTFHSVDSLDLARQIDRIADELGLFPTVYLEVNVAGDAAKFGFSPEGLRCDLEAILSLGRLQTAGLMTIPPFTEDPEDAREHFAALREFRDELAERTGTPLTGLSMGMSHDFEVAIEEGATSVRVGSAIFGRRRAAKPAG